MAKKKRYHQSKKDRMNERYGMEHYVEREAEERYERRGRAYPDGGNEYSGMISEDFSKPSNLPTKVVMKPYPKYNSVMQNYDYDTLMDATECMNDSARIADRHKKKRGRY